MIKWMLKRRLGIVAKKSRTATKNCAYLKTSPTRVRSGTFSLDDRPPQKGERMADAAFAQ
jgi:hypothetical protein